MARERWATFSVVAHQDAAALAREVLLYDKLILPVPPDDAERERWRRAGWQPELLDDRLEQLQGLAWRLNWDDRHRAAFHRMMETVRNEVSPFAATPMVIRDYIVPQVRESGIRVVAGFRSEADFRRDFVAPARDAAQAAFTFALVHELVVPFAERAPEPALKAAAELARDEDFREHRRAFYEWQEAIGARIARGELTAADARHQLGEMIDRYNRRVEKADRRARRSLVVTLAGTALGIAAALVDAHGLGSALSAASAALPAASFLLVDARPEAAVTGVEPAVMFHEMQRVLR